MSLPQLAINTIRTLAMDAVQKANSGHPGAPMGFAPVGYYLWQEVLSFDPNHASWPNRDRFVLSNGHASMLLYALLYLSQTKSAQGLAVSLDDIKQFRQLGSHCPGHPEHGVTSGVETTTGPLGQGFANAVGMAMAQRWLASRYNQPGFKLFDYKIYTFGGDGCMMEGLSSEAASLAGHLKLSNLCFVYDSNQITIEGHTDLAFSEDVAKRFLSYNWDVTHVTNANDLGELRQAFASFSYSQKPLLIIVNSHIGFGAPTKQDSSSAHGEPLGVEEVRLAKKAYGWPEDAQFLVPPEVIEHFAAGIGLRGRTSFDNWTELFTQYQTQFPELAAELGNMWKRELPSNWDADLPIFGPDPKGMATRVASGKVLNAIAKQVPWFMGGAADLAPSTKTLIEDKSGRNMHFGVREHAMTAILSGLSLSYIRPYGATFLTFSDYARPSIRLAALMELPNILIYTHDSISLGEDGPTHQPIEHIASLRAMPGLVTMRPADANEVTECWRVLMKLKNRPVALMLSRQNLPVFDRTHMAPASMAAKGAYVLSKSSEQEPKVLLLATGSEVALCLEAQKQLNERQISSWVVSMPSWELFENQTREYKESVLPGRIQARVAVEQASSFGWHQYTGDKGHIIAIDTFGASAPDTVLQKHFGFTTAHVVEAACKLL